MYPTKDAFEDDDFLFPKVGYISFLEGIFGAFRDSWDI